VLWWLCAALDNGTGNSASAVLNLAPLDDGGAQPAGTLSYITVNTWNGASFDTAYYESDFTANNYGPSGTVQANANGPTNGWATDGNGSLAIVAPILAPGSGFFINNPSAVGQQTWVGSVKPAPGTTNSMTIPGGNSLIASVLPVSGNLSSVAMQFPLAPLDDGGAQPAGTLSYITINTWNGASFDSAYYESDFTANNYGPSGTVQANPHGPTNGWATDGNGSLQIAAPTVNVGYGFFINNPSAVGAWAQHL
jgi:hypothetical protein